MNDSENELSLSDICHAVDLPEQTFIRLVEYGIVEPNGDEPTQWTFDLTMVSTARRASRLRRDLNLNWTAVALVVELIEEKEQLQEENEILNQRLQRFFHDE